MEGRILAGRYGEAYYQVLSAGNALSAGAEDLGLLLAVLKETRLGAVLASPNIATAEKLALLKGQFEGKVHPLTLRLLGLVIEKQRAAHLREIVEGILALMDERAGIVDALAVTAFELPQALSQKLHQLLEKRTGKRVRLAQQVDPSLIGGITIRVGDAYLDGSFKTILEHVKQHLILARVA